MAVGRRPDLSRGFRKGFCVFPSASPGARLHLSLAKGSFLACPCLADSQSAPAELFLVTLKQAAGINAG